MDKMTKIILASAIGITLIGVVFIMGLVMKLSTATTENSNLVKQITDQNSSIKDNNAEVEKQMNAALNKQKLENDLRIDQLRKEMKTASDSAAADLEAVKAERAQLTETIAEKLKKKEDELTPLQKKIREAPAIAKVVAVKEALGFVVIDAGSAKGIEKGSRFNIRRDKFIVAEVEIDEVVDSSNSIGNIDIDKKPPGINIREGDEIIGYPVF
ncbi:MAG: hypothetical protein DBX02_05915 [Verrucomicrobia bacterium]|nr:MAG: hypothetical protein CBC36_10465 [Verrucomicrobiaceae bacterium TMED76]RCL29783.1 MAG: hypothetical protein DBX02_05915 [Verrucomicrobiota bacterium]|tara:strand:+ start:1678 stop:2316 length:639 start_codon:yes stop_codon:yes gene_type:complete